MINMDAVEEYRKIKQVFTDEDLRMMKEYAELDKPYTFYNFGQPILALIARLEAAERFIDQSFMPIEWEYHPDYKAWRKSKGAIE